MQYDAKKEKNIMTDYEYYLTEKNRRQNRRNKKHSKDRNNSQEDRGFPRGRRGKPRCENRSRVS